MLKYDKEFKIAVMKKFNKLKENSGNSVNSGIKIMNRISHVSKRFK